MAKTKKEPEGEVPPLPLDQGQDIERTAPIEPTLQPPLFARVNINRDQRRINLSRYIDLLSQLSALGPHNLDPFSFSEFGAAHVVEFSWSKVLSEEMGDGYREDVKHELSIELSMDLDCNPVLKTTFNGKTGDRSIADIISIVQGLK